MKRVVILVLVLALAIGGGAWWWSHRATDGQVRLLETATIDRGAVRRVLQQTGIVKSQVGASVKIGARATGTIEQMLVKVGDRVEKGQLVARIDSRELRLDRAEAAAQLEQAQAEVAYRQSNYRRLQQLAGSRVISADELEDARRQAVAAAATVEARQAALAALDIRLSYTEIHATIAGVVSQVTAQEGETVVAGLQVANLVTVIDPTRLEMWIYVDETDVGQVVSGQTVEFTVDAYPGKTFIGTVQRIYPQPEIRDNIVYYQAIVTLDAEQATFLRPDMTTQVQIVVEERADVLRLPNAALKWVAGEQRVYVATDGGSPRAVQPKLGLTGDRYSEIVDGLRAGDQVGIQLTLPGNGAKKPEGGNDRGPRP